jgi:WD40 repeat protein
MNLERASSNSDFTVQKTRLALQLNSTFHKRTLKGHTEWINTMVINEKSNELISASDDKTIKIWDKKTGLCKRTLTGHTDWVYSLVINNETGELISGSKDLKTGECKKKLEGHTDMIDSLVINHKGNELISGSSDKTIKFWNLSTDKCLRNLENKSD